MDKELILFCVTGISILLMVLLFGLSIHNNLVVAEMVKNGANPIEAGCAVGTISEYRCIELKTGQKAKK